MVKKSQIETIRFDGGRLCLDYINTVHDRFEEPMRDYLESVNDLIHWSFRAGVIDSGTMKTLKRNAHEKTEEAETFFTEAIRLREILFGMFLCIARNQSLPEKGLEAFNNLVSLYFPHLRIGLRGNDYGEEWNYPAGSFNLISAPVLKDAYDLLLHGKQIRIRECPNCGWLFYDTSKNASRRWCSMETCGSNVKALSWYHKHKSRET